MKQVLVVDDEPHMARVLKLQLERAGFAVQCCRNGQEALHALCSRAPDAMITDIQMPVMTGRQLCEALHEQLPQRTFPVFVMTSRTEREEREWTAAIPNVELLEKPLSMRVVIAKLHQILGTGAATASVADG
jgi:CheY-like chemotaxis protein